MNTKRQTETKTVDCICLNTTNEREEYLSDLKKNFYVTWNFDTSSSCMFSADYNDHTFVQHRTWQVLR